MTTEEAAVIIVGMICVTFLILSLNDRRRK
jgi:hypothetical protein